MGRCGDEDTELGLAERIAPGWLVVQVFGTLLLLVALLTASASALVWVICAAGFLCWLFFAVFDRTLPRPATVTLALASVLPTLVTGLSADGTAILMAGVPLGIFAALPWVSANLIIVFAGLHIAVEVASCAIADKSWVTMLGYAVVLLVSTLFGLNRRQYQVQALQTELLLEQTHLKNDEHAKAAALRERARIAREIHDVLAHSLGALSVQLDVAEGLLSVKDDHAGALERLRRSRRLANEGLAEARRAVAALRGNAPPLSVSLQRMAAEHQRDHGVQVTYQTNGTPRPISPGATISLLRAAREALTNAAKHAPGSPVTVLVEYAPTKLVLRVSNEEMPSSPAPEESGAQPPGYGLVGMGERLALVSGTLVAGQPAGPGRAGWLVTAEVPE
ncbi:sensor histidine kinase [Sciscionella marina]|uniref:sensor histidine kinase n=1 Tax=Sciscionella marina TaxID=508770 RepID=UPI0003707D01|nr:histidine kinase [Sciscionella marina]